MQVVSLYHRLFYLGADDGSSLSCCWTNADAAERLLKIHEITQIPFFHNRRSSVKVGIRGSCDTVGYHLEKMLKKHHKVIVKNNRASPDSSALGFTFIVDSKEVFSCSDERLLRLIVLNASSSSPFVSTEPLLMYKKVSKMELLVHILLRSRGT